MTRNEIVTEARTWLGTPWKHQGRVRGRACDCLGLVVSVLKKFDPTLGGYDDDRKYGHIPESKRLSDTLAKHLHVIPRKEAKPGDIALISFSSSPMHLGFFTDKGIIHAYSMGGRRVVEHAIIPELERAIARVYRIPGIKD